MPPATRAAIPDGRTLGRQRPLAVLPADHICAPCPIRLQTFCAVMDARELAEFKSQGPTLRMEKARFLFHEGDQAEFVFNLTRGTLKLYKLLPDGRRQITGFLHPGEFLGLTLEEEHAFTAETVEPAEYCRFPRARFEAFVEAHPRLERELYHMAAHELRAAREQMVVLGRKTALERLATFLQGLFDRSSRRNADWEIVRVPMSRVDIADFLGLTKETVSRTFSLLRRRRVIRLLPGDRVELIDRTALEDLSGGYGF